MALGLRHVVVQGVGFVANLILARALVPSDFGAFAFVTVVTQLSMLLGDAGLGAALVQRRERLSNDLLAVVFTFQQVLLLGLVLAVWFASPWLISYYHFPPEYVWLVRLTILSLGFTSLRAVSALVLERNVDFQKIAKVEIAEALTYYLLCSAFAVSGFGVWSFAWAAIARAAVGAAVMFRIAPWRVALRWDFPAIKELARFGLPFQGSNLLGFANSSLTPVILGATLGPAAVGFVNFAASLVGYASMPAWVINRVSFPAFSRMQGEESAFADAFLKLQRASALMMFGIAALLLGLAEPIIVHVFSAKWQPSVPIFTLLALGLYVSAWSVPNGSVLNALGESRLNFRLNIAVTLTMWLFGIPLMLAFGVMGVAYATLLSNWVHPVTNHILQKRFRYALIRHIWPPLLASGLTAAVLHLASRAVEIENLLTLAAMLIAGMLGYLSLNFLFDRKGTTAFLGQFVRTFERKA